MSICGGCKRAKVQFITWGMLYLHNDIFVTDIVGCDWPAKILLNLYPQNGYATDVEWEM